MSGLDGAGNRVEGLPGTVERFTFRSEDSGFAVVRFLPEGPGGAIQIVGTLAQLAEGQHVRITGKRTIHPRFGPQIEVEVAEASMPHSTDGIRAYLASSLVKGVGEATAEKIVDRFGTDTLRIIDEEPERLREIKGLGAKRIDEIVAAVRSHKGIQDVMVFLRAHGLGQALAVRIVKRLGPEAASRIQADPFRLVDDVIGVGFRTADQLAGRLGIEADSPQRVRAGIQHRLALAARDGHCAMPEDALIDGAADLLEIDAEIVRRELTELIALGRVRRDAGVLDDPAAEAPVYPLKLHLAECGVAELLRALAASRPRPLVVDPRRALDEYERRHGIELAEGQRRAVLCALDAPVSVVTGGPGVGKTTIVRALVELTQAARGSTVDGPSPVLLAAPTGRAARRMEESTGHPASTIHRLLDYQPGLGRFLRDSDRPLEGELLVVDEASMLDVQLAYELCRAIPEGLRLVLVGDVDQLPSVGPGQVLADVIHSGAVPVTRLTEIYRQAGQSQIVRAAHQVLQGRVPESAPEGGDFFAIHSDDPTRTRALLRHVVTERIPQAFGLDPVADVQVLCPMYRGLVGADQVNLDLQAALNPEGHEIERAGRTFRVGDKVLQIRNDYDLDLSNGDTGRILAIERGSSTLRVLFDRGEVEYPFGDLDQLVPAYAITVHRSQGSEYPAVVIPVVSEHFLMLRRNLLYTAMTRGKQLVVLVGAERALRMAVERADESRRCTGLGVRLAQR